MRTTQTPPANRALLTTAIGLRTGYAYNKASLVVSLANSRSGSPLSNYAYDLRNLLQTNC